MKNKIEVILGQRGRGKTSLSMNLSLPAVRLVVYDPCSEYTNGVILENFSDLREYLGRVGPLFRLIARFDRSEEVDQLFDLCFELGNLMVVAEEVDIIAPPDGRASDSFLRLVRRGRHKSIDIVAVSRRAAEVNKLLRSQTDVFHSFAQTEPGDLDYCKKLGFDVDTLKNLEYYQYVSTN